MAQKKQSPFRELAAKPRVELEKTLTEERDRLWTLKNDLAQGKVKNVAAITVAKRSIARLLTALNKGQ